MSSASYDGSFSGSAEDGFWFVCTSDGTITLCSSDASRFGLAVGSGNAAEVIEEDQIPELEDAMKIIEGGGDVSFLLSASPSTGYSLAHMRSGILFGVPVARVRLYKNKNEYLADSFRRNDSIGRVFGYKGNNKNKDGIDEDELSNAGYGTDIFELGLVRFERSAMQFLMGINHIESVSRGNDESELTDVSAVFEIIKKKYADSEKKPFDAKFENGYKETRVISNISQGRFAGLVLISLAVAARLSDTRQCKVSFCADGNSVTIFAESKLYRNYSMYCRSSELSWLHVNFGGNPTELLILEYLSSFPGHNTEFRCDMDGNFVLSTEISTEVDPDRLKYRDSTLGVDIITDKYISYLNDSFSPDTQ